MIILFTVTETKHIVKIIKNIKQDIVPSFAHILV